MNVGGKHSETFYQREQTDIVLDAFGQELVLRRQPEWEDDGEGGVVRPDDEVPVSLPSQLLWFHEAAPIAHVSRGTTYQQTIGMGERAITAYVLMGRYDADIKKGDEFDIAPYTYRVEFVHPDRVFQTIAEVERITDAQG